jgi:hypothetical protein
VRDWIACIGLFAATAAVILWQNAHLAVLWDLSYVLNAATRIAGGQVPYRDFPLVQAPLTFLVQAAIIRFTGRVYFHHVLYVSLVGGLGTVLTWRVALDLLRARVDAAWTIALLLAAPLTMLGIYCIVPNPEYDCDCAFWILVAIWFLLQVDFVPHPSAACNQDEYCHPERPDPEQGRRGRESKDLRLLFGGWGRPHQFARGFAAGTAICVPLFVKQNIGLPFLVACVGAVLVVLASTWFGRDRTSEHKRVASALLAILAGAGAALLVGALTLHFTSGIGNCLHWTIGFAGQRRLPGLNTMLGVYLSSSLPWMLACAVAGLMVLRWLGRNRWAQIAAFLMLAAPFVFALAALFLYDDADERGDSLLALWPLLLLLAGVLALWNLVRLRRELTLRAFVPLVLLVAVNGTMMSQQLWGSTYAIWPLLVLLLAEMIVFLDGLAMRGGVSRWFAPALAAFVSATLLICGGFYTASEERLSYAQFPDGPVMHSAYPALAGMATPGPYLPELDELLRYADAHIPSDDAIMLIPGEDPLFFATGRPQMFPTTDWDVTCDPYSPAEIAAMARARNIRWLIVKTDLQLREDPTPDRAATMNLLMREFALGARLRGYDVYRASAAE